MDLGVVQLVLQVVTQGDFNANGYTTTFKLAQSLDSVTFATLAETFVANTDHAGRVYTTLPTPLRTRHVRLIPQTWSGLMSIRADVAVASHTFEAPPSPLQAAEPAPATLSTPQVASTRGEYIKPRRSRSPATSSALILAGPECHSLDLAQGWLERLAESHEDWIEHRFEDLLQQPAMNFDASDGRGWAARTDTDGSALFENRRAALFFNQTVVIDRVTISSGSDTGGHLTVGSLSYANDRAFQTLETTSWQPVRDLAMADSAGSGTSWGNHFNVSGDAAAAGEVILKKII